MEESHHSSAWKRDGLLHPAALPYYIKPLPTSLASSTCESLRRTGCFDLPDIDARIELVATYLEWVQPAIPMIEPAQLERISAADPHGLPISLLLLKSIEMAADVFLRRNDCAVNSLAQQVEALLKAKVETDPVMILQSLILLTFNDSAQTGSKDSYHWMGIACQYAERMLAGGFAGAKARDSTRETFRSLIMRDAIVALAARKPRQVSTEIEFHVASVPDHDCERVVGEELQSEMDRTSHELCKAIQAAVDAKLSRASTTSSHEATYLLRQWHGRWYGRLWQDSGDAAKIVHDSVLLSYWSLAVLTLLCWSSQPASSSSASSAGDNSLITAALDSTTAIFARLHEQNLLQFVPSTAIAALAPAAVAYLMNSTSQQQFVRAANSRKYYQCWQILRELRSKYQTAFQAMRMLDSLGQDIRKGLETGDAEQVAKLRQWCNNISTAGAVAV
jgi:hypothetical protein